MPHDGQQGPRSGRNHQVIDPVYRRDSAQFTTSPSQNSYGTYRKPRPPEGTPNRSRLLRQRRHGIELDEGQHVDIESIDGVDATEPQRPAGSTVLSSALDTLGLLNTSSMEELSEFRDLAGISATTEQNTTNLPHDTLPDGNSREVGHGLESRTSNACDWDTYQDRCEMALFLRCFSEGPGKWTDVLGSHQPYFSQNIITLSQTSPLIRYAACALGANYLGRVKGPALKTHTTMRNGFTESQPDFIWYGTKYYDKALQLLAQQAQDPCDSHGITMTGDPDTSYDRAANIYPAIAECILSQYVDISETITTAAISIHLDNVDKLLRFSDYDPASPWTLKHVPEPDKAISSIFWCFAINDALDSYVSRRRTRLDPNNLSLWRELGGLPLNDKGDLLLDHISEQQKATLLFKSLVRLLCQLLNSSLSDTAEWISINSEFDRWYSILPSWFSSPLVWTWAPDECPDQNPRHPAASSATWFSCDTCALAMAFYHMGRMLLLIHQPIELFLEQYGDQPDVLYTYKKWWKDLRQHSSQTVSIARGMPNDTVRKYLLQPLHVAGRCMLDTRDRLELLDIFKQIGDDLGVATEYYRRDLCGTWGYPLSCARDKLGE